MTDDDDFTELFNAFPKDLQHEVIKAVEESDATSASRNTQVSREIARGSNAYGKDLRASVKPRHLEARDRPIDRFEGLARIDHLRVQLSNGLKSLGDKFFWLRFALC
jgi:hypothetical protein